MHKCFLSNHNCCWRRRSTKRNNKQDISENCAPFTNCISKINYIEIDNVEDLDIVMPINTLLEYSNNYAKTSASL